MPYGGRCEMSTHFRATNYTFDCCVLCGLAIQPGELFVVDADSESMDLQHADCRQMEIEEFMGEGDE